MELLEKSDRSVSLGEYTTVSAEYRLNDTRVLSAARSQHRTGETGSVDEERSNA